ncbi:MAG: helix-turn-helix domain-containing protein [Ruminococcus flavefaciens]|nr:helix-turn-helix domain-containing protein [Ruminococcus flavefaciens]
MADSKPKSKQFEYMQLYQMGYSISQIASHYGVNKSTVSRTLDRATRITCPFSATCSNCPLPECAFKPEYQPFINIADKHNVIRAPRRTKAEKDVVDKDINSTSGQENSGQSREVLLNVTKTKFTSPKSNLVLPSSIWKAEPHQRQSLKKSPVKHRELMMTDDEIRASFRQAKDQFKQISVLAELNATSKEMIRQILGLTE